MLMQSKMQIMPTNCKPQMEGGDENIPFKLARNISPVPLAPVQNLFFQGIPKTCKKCFLQIFRKKWKKKGNKMQNGSNPQIYFFVHIYPPLPHEGKLMNLDRSSSHPTRSIVYFLFESFGSKEKRKCKMKSS